MNKIIVSNDQIESNFTLEKTIDTIYIDVPDCFITYMNTDRKLKIVLRCDSVISEYLVQASVDLTYTSTSKFDLCLYRFAYDSSYKTAFMLDYEATNLNFISTGLNKNENNYQVDIYHNGKLTEALTDIHVINLSDQAFTIGVNSHLKKTGLKASSRQESMVILTRDAKVTIKPDLLVDHDNMQAEHSSYIGSFKESDLFYLMARSLPRSEAIKMLAKAFLIDKMQIDYNFKQLIIDYIAKYF